MWFICHFHSTGQYLYILCWWPTVARRDAPHMHTLCAFSFSFSHYHVNISILKSYISLYKKVSKWSACSAPACIHGAQIKWIFIAFDRSNASSSKSHIYGHCHKIQYAFVCPLLLVLQKQTWNWNEEIYVNVLRCKSLHCDMCVPAHEWAKRKISLLLQFSQCNQ